MTYVVGRTVMAWRSTTQKKESNSSWFFTHCRIACFFFFVFFCGFVGVGWGEKEIRVGWLAVYIHRMRPRQPWHHGKHTRSVKCAYYIQTHTRTHPQVVAEVEGARGLHPRQHALPPLRLPRRRRRVRVRVCVCGLIGNASMRERERDGPCRRVKSSQARHAPKPTPNTRWNNRRPLQTPHPHQPTCFSSPPSAGAAPPLLIVATAPLRGIDAAAAAACCGHSAAGLRSTKPVETRAAAARSSMMAEGSRRCRRVALGMPVGGMVHARTTHGAGARGVILSRPALCVGLGGFVGVRVLR